MSDDSPQIGGYEWSISCPCGETMAANGLNRGKRDGEWLHDRRTGELPQSDGDTIRCENCGRTWRMEFEEVDRDV